MSSRGVERRGDLSEVLRQAQDTRLLRRFNLLAMTIGLALTAPFPVLAASPTPNSLFTHPSDIPRPTIGLPNLINLHFTSVEQVMAYIIYWLTWLGGLAAFLFVLYGGFRYLTAGGNPANADAAKRIIIGSLIGMVIMALSYAIVRFVIVTLSGRV